MTSNRPQAKATRLIDDERVTVTRFDFEPGAETGWHTHGHDYVITTLTQCSMLLEEPGGANREAEFEAHEVYSRPEGVEHNVINNGKAPMSFIETEIKSGK